MSVYQPGVFERAPWNSLFYRVFVQNLVFVLWPSWFLKDASPFITLFFVLNEWQDDKCVYWRVSVGWKWFCESKALRVERPGPLNISVSRKRTRSDDFSQVNLIVGWNELANLTKMEVFSTRTFQLRENVSSMNLFQTEGFNGLAASSRFSRSAMKITEKATF